MIPLYYSKSWLNFYIFLHFPTTSNLYCSFSMHLFHPLFFLHSRLTAHASLRKQTIWLSSYPEQMSIHMLSLPSILLPWKTYPCTYKSLHLCSGLSSFQEVIPTVPYTSSVSISTGLSTWTIRWWSLILNLNSLNLGFLTQHAHVDFS